MSDQALFRSGHRVNDLQVKVKWFTTN